MYYSWLETSFREKIPQYKKRKKKVPDVDVFNFSQKTNTIIGEDIIVWSLKSD